MLVCNDWHGDLRTEKIEELLLSRMHPVLEHRSFSLVVRIRLLEQNLGFVIPSLLLNFLNDLLLARSEITCHLNLTCQKKSLYTVAQRNILS
jgi:hypothetical protein